ncbi:hypothetical protein BS47DRAFT_1355790 [Hydnum rufescens UP504]|uniref:Uncharacterized protein n=1 Tax=Hydnum rufescens UP504 TaxID=1448309 RepID=A0A9P6DMT7_9AGAM|nr:hypothetical protein BS47DRAFT_1355790 [Hydnum rufescens UP504]
MPTLAASSPVVNSAIHYQYSDSTPIAPLFSPVKAHDSHQAANTPAPTLSHNHGNTIYPLNTAAPWNDTEFGFYDHNHDHNPQPAHNYTQPAPPPTMWNEDPFTSTSSLSSSYYDQNVAISSSAGTYDPLGSLKKPSAEAFATPQQLAVRHDPDDRMSSPRGSYRAAHR